MQNIKTTLISSGETDNPVKPLAPIVDAGQVSNALIKRLIEEVKFDSQNNILAYNRTHNRHNRGR
jgi:hypothetical protein